MMAASMARKIIRLDGASYIRTNER
jgi:histidinol-phosphatase (PHP family)